MPGWRGQFTGVLLSADTVWNWIQSARKQALLQWESQIQALEEGQLPEPEAKPSNISRHEVGDRIVRKSPLTRKNEIYTE